MILLRIQAAAGIHISYGIRRVDVTSRPDLLALQVARQYFLSKGQRLDLNNPQSESFARVSQLNKNLFFFTLAVIA